MQDRPYNSLNPLGSYEYRPNKDLGGGRGRKSTRAELVQWCNELARSQGLLNQNPKLGPIYFCTEVNYGQ